MTNKLERAARQALEALEYETSSHKSYNRKPLLSSLEAITALREALAEQAEHESVMVVEVDAMGIPEITWDKFEEYDAGRYELYAAPVRTKNLTDDEIDAIPFNVHQTNGDLIFARAVIAADREKNK